MLEKMGSINFAHFCGLIFIGKLCCQCLLIIENLVFNYVCEGLNLKTRPYSFLYSHLVSHSELNHKIDCLCKMKLCPALTLEFAFNTMF